MVLRLGKGFGCAFGVLRLEYSSQKTGSFEVCSLDDFTAHFPCTSTSRFFEARDHTCIIRKHLWLGLRCCFSYCEIACKASCYLERSVIIGQNRSRKVTGFQYVPSSLLGNRVHIFDRAFFDRALGQILIPAQCRPCFNSLSTMSKTPSSVSDAFSFHPTPALVVDTESVRCL